MHHSCCALPCSRQTKTSGMTVTHTTARSIVAGGTTTSYLGPTRQRSAGFLTHPYTRFVTQGTHWGPQHTVVHVLKLHANDQQAVHAHRVHRLHTRSNTTTNTHTQLSCRAACDPRNITMSALQLQHQLEGVNANHRHNVTLNNTHTYVAHANQATSAHSWWRRHIEPARSNHRAAAIQQVTQPPVAMHLEL